mmetsp:Transcript_35854/g.62987  ORF Transcript_35854/g.62987 Transcript_35854/m.62987 type:complete len:85 (+) Transcript_35854:363-617(+)
MHVQLWFIAQDELLKVSPCRDKRAEVQGCTGSAHRVHGNEAVLLPAAAIFLRARGSSRSRESSIARAIDVLPSAAARVPLFGSR